MKEHPECKRCKEASHIRETGKVVEAYIREVRQARSLAALLGSRVIAYGPTFTQSRQRYPNASQK